MITHELTGSCTHNGHLTFAAARPSFPAARGARGGVASMFPEHCLPGSVSVRPPRWTPSEQVTRQAQRCGQHEASSVCREVAVHSAYG